MVLLIARVSHYLCYFLVELIDDQEISGPPISPVPLPAPCLKPPGAGQWEEVSQLLSQLLWQSWVFSQFQLRKNTKEEHCISEKKK